MLPRINCVKALENFNLRVTFDDGKTVRYDAGEDIKTLPGYHILAENNDLFGNVQLDESRTVVYWTEGVDLPSDILYEYGTAIQNNE